MSLGILALLCIVLWVGLTMANACRCLRVIPFVLSYAAIIASVFLYGVDNHNYLYATAVIAVTVAMVIGASVVRKQPMFIGYGVLSLMSALFVFVFYYLLPSAASILDLSH